MSEALCKSRVEPCLVIISQHAVLVRVLSNDQEAKSQLLGLSAFYMLSTFHSDSNVVILSAHHGKIGRWRRREEGEVKRTGRGRKGRALEVPPTL